MTPASELIAYLRDAGAGDRGHAGGRPLLDHLIGTAEVVRRWGQPDVLQQAALIHSVYGTEAYRRPLVPADGREELRALAGERAERLAHLFAVTPRRALITGTHRWAPALATAPREDLDALVLLHMANLADQARAPDGSPGTWLVALHRLAELVFDSHAVTLPRFLAQLSAFTPEDEAAAREAYRDGVAHADSERLAMAVARCPVIAEPCAWIAAAARQAGDDASAREWAAVARVRLRELGTSWDKRLTYDEWLTVTERLGEPGPPPGGDLPTDPRRLYRALLDGRPGGPPAPGGGPPASAGRFTRYMQRIADAPHPGGRVLYPELTSRPWWDPETFPLARELAAHFPQIQAECLALDPAGFTPESERIGRTGDWDVRFLHERGRRHEATCAACPTTARIIEQHGGLLTAAGLSYLSRMRPGTHIAPHRGPTNLRLRCHLGIVVPEGDTAIRVEGEARGWREGGCLVFDDSYEHEAWNHTAGDRLVLIVDLWHPDLSDAEVHLLAGLQRYAASYARGLERYWQVNDAAREESPPA